MSLPDQPNRLTDRGLVDRTQPLAFRFDGARYEGFAGDTLASALLAAGVRRLGRSFKYHRPRGVLASGSEEPNALVQLRTGARQEPNTKATTTELFEGLEASSQNRWPSLAFDVGALGSWVTPLLAAGFYYKTFMWPAPLWEKLYEPLIRRAAGLGRASDQPDPDGYDKAHAFCDVLVVGAGPAGLAAALAAGRCGARVILCDEDFRLGGRLNGERRQIDGTSATEWAQRIESELRAMKDVSIFRRTTVFGAYDGISASEHRSGSRTFAALERVSDHRAVPLPHQPRQRLWKIVARRCVVAAGAVERPIVFSGNDRPGVMLASAVRTYVNRFGVTPGRRVAIFTSGDDGWRTAFDLAASVAIEAIIDSRSSIAPALLARAKSVDARVFAGSHVVATHGWGGLRQITVRDAQSRESRLDVDTLAISGGWNPALALATHLGGRPRWSAELSAFVPGDVPDGMVVRGAANGTFLLADALHDGSAAGVAAAQDLGLSRVAASHWSVDDESSDGAPLWFVANATTKAFVDFQNDVTYADIALAAREGYRSAELVKRYTTLGMATDQGRATNLNGHAILAALTGRAIQDVGTTASRPPYAPVAIGAFAGRERGRSFKPTRLTASHRWAQEQGAVFMEAGEWLRAQWFAKPSETHWLQTVSREARAVRTSVGVCDVSTLGKIEIQGEDAPAFLDRVYVNHFSSLSPGRVRYGVMLREDGFVFDDGTTAHLCAGRYVMTTTTANAGRVMQHLQHARQVLWPELDVQLSSVTEQWAQFAIAGPESRRLLERLLGAAVDLSDTALPYLGCAPFRWSDVDARLFRISYSGELAYELAVPARYGDAAIRAIMSAGEILDVTPYGIEALGVLRIEKGHVAGNELNGTTTAADLGLGRLVSGAKDCIGKVLSGRPALLDPNRPVLVGIKPLDRKSRLHAGAHLLTPGEAPRLENDQGYVTSVAFSPALGHWIGLGLLARGRNRLGERIRVHDPIRSGDVEAEVVSPVFIDPQGARLRG